MTGWTDAARKASAEARKRKGKSGKKPAGAVSISAIRARTPEQQKHYAKKALVNKPPPPDAPYFARKGPDS